MVTKLGIYVILLKLIKNIYIVVGSPYFWNGGRVERYNTSPLPISNIPLNSIPSPGWLGLARWLTGWPQSDGPLQDRGRAGLGSGPARALKRGSSGNAAKTEGAEQRESQPAQARPGRTGDEAGRDDRRLLSFAYSPSSNPPLPGPLYCPPACLASASSPSLSPSIAGLLPAPCPSLPQIWKILRFWWHFRHNSPFTVATL